MANLPCISLPVSPFKYKYRITAWYMYLALGEKHAFASLAMFDIQYFIKEWLDKHAILYTTYKICIETRHENFDHLGHLKWDRLVTY